MAAPVDEHLGGIAVDLDDRAVSQQAAKGEGFALLAAHSREHYVFVIPVAAELDLKAAARSVGEKAVEMIHVADINKLTGYIRGGCSPIGMKKLFATVLDESCLSLDTIVFSAGKIGMQIEMDPRALLEFIGAKTAVITAG